MLRIKIELVPFGNEKIKHDLCVAEIKNDGTGNRATGNYNVNFYECDRDGNKLENPNWSTKIENFARLEEAPWTLLYKALQKWENQNKGQAE